MRFGCKELDGSGDDDDDASFGHQIYSVAETRRCQWHPSPARHPDFPGVRLRPVHSQVLFFLPASLAFLWPSLSSSVWSPGTRPVMERWPRAGPRSKEPRHVEMHSTGLLQGQVPDQRLADRSLHICAVFSRLVFFRTGLKSPENPLAEDSTTDPNDFQ